MRLTPEERKSIDSCEGEVKKLQKARDKRVSSVFQQIGAERKQQHQLLLKHHLLTVECLVDGLSSAGLVPSKQPERPKERPKGPTLKTLERAKLYKRLKDKHPTWSQSRVAIEANIQMKVDYHTRDTVRHAYSAMGWEWERADRIR